MSEEKDKKPPEEGEERTVFMPGGGGVPPPPSPTEAPPAAPTEPATPATPSTEAPPAAPTEPATSEAPAEPATPEARAESAEPAAGAPAPEPPASAETAAPVGFAPHKDAARIKVGDVLNHIFRVDRFLARGGMGEVFEGCNVHTDERVAIKVMLPALADDEKVIAMFRKEARTLTKLHHEALVEYRVLAQEPELHVLYIVTDFITGTNLGASLGTLKPSPEELAGLLRRLAEGLASAHKLGAVHRDMSPDNVILEKEDIHQAKIIDFGIAKDLDASSATIVGDGFAGKLNYVAPEQLGDFGREIGPWSDVYSLGLVILAVAQGRNVDMSGSLVDAIDKRRRGPDISAIPDDLKPLIEAMLRADPKERLRSMDDVLTMLDGARIPGPTTVREEVAEEAAAPTGGLSTPGSGGSKPLLIILGVLAGIAALLALGWYLTGGDLGLGGGAASSEVANVASNDSAPEMEGRSPADVARATIDSVVPSVNCTWLDIGDIRDGDPMTVSMRGVAGNTANARREIGRALEAAGLANTRLEFGDVAPITQAGCAVLDTFRQLRARSDFRMTAAQPRFEMEMQSDGPYAGRLAANAVVNLNLADPDLDFALAGIEPSGAITLLLGSRADFERALAGSVNGRPINDEGGGRYRLAIDLDHSGWSGLLLVTGRGPFPPALVAAPIGERGPDWQGALLGAAANLGWRTEMVWFESVDRRPDAAAPADGDKDDF